MPSQMLTVESSQVKLLPTFPTSYTYNLAGAMISMTYPSGRTITNTFDGAGRLASFAGNLGDGTQRTYSTGIVYSAFGRRAKEQFGTTTPLFNKSFYNSRGQLAEIRVSTSYTGPADTTWNRGAIINHYSYQCWGMCGGPNSTTPMPDNNGNLRKQDVYIPADDQVSSYTMRWQEYDYDSLNRLRWVREISGETEIWRQSYLYDRYGNRTINYDGTTPGIPRPQFDTNDFQATNRLYAPGDTALPTNQRQMRYDSAGNLNYDAYTGQGTRVYDAENRMIEAQGNGQLQYYSYDSDGRRVKRKIDQVETWQVYGIGGELLAEYPLNGVAANPQKEYGYRNGELLITATASTAGWGAPPSYTGPNPLLNGHDIKLENLTELRTAVNSLRSHAGVPPFNFTVDPNPQQNVTTVKADHIRQLRLALEGARNALGLSVGGYTHPTLTENFSLIYAIDFQELRNQVASAWQSGGGVDIRWLVADQLGTPRMIFDQTGSLANVNRHDYLPFGEELFAGTGGRTTGQGYPSGPNAIDGARQKFTQKERDNETGLDYFGARYYSCSQGRFTSIDPAAIKRRTIRDPRDLNRYTYVANNPLRYVDPTGEEKIEIIFRTYIPSPTVTYPSKIGPTFNGNVDSKGNRLPGSEGFKTEHRIIVETDAKRGKLIQHQEHSVGPTHRLARGFGSVITPSEGQSSGKTLNETARRDSQDTVTASFTGNEKNPLTSPDVTAGISYDVNVTVRSLGTDFAASVHIKGLHDAFPAYEVTVVRPEAGTQATVTVHDPSKTGDDPSGLFGPQRTTDIMISVDKKKKQ